MSEVNNLNSFYEIVDGQFDEVVALDIIQEIFLDPTAHSYCLDLLYGEEASSNTYSEFTKYLADNYGLSVKQSRDVFNRFLSYQGLQNA